MLPMLDLGLDKGK